MSLKDHREDILAAFTITLDHCIAAAEDRTPSAFRSNLAFSFEGNPRRFTLGSICEIDLTKPAKPQLEEMQMRQAAIFLPRGSPNASMTPEDLSAFIDETEGVAGRLARQAARALERFITEGSDGDFEAYRQWQAEALLLFWRLARIREAVRAHGDAPFTEDLITRIQVFIVARPPWDPEALVRSMARPVLPSVQTIEAPPV